MWHFENRDSSIYVKYMHIFLMGKQEALGYLAGATDQESIKNYETQQGILLEADKIEVNPVKRQVSKLSQQLLG